MSHSDLTSPYKSYEVDQVHSAIKTDIFRFFQIDKSNCLLSDVTIMSNPDVYCVAGTTSAFT